MKSDYDDDHVHIDDPIDWGSVACTVFGWGLGVVLFSLMLEPTVSWIVGLMA